METKFDPDDYWARAVTFFTGYSMPSRSTLFDKMKSKEGIPLMRVNLVEHGMRAVNRSDYGAVMGWQASHGEDYRLAFYTHHGQEKVKLWTADIVFIGVLSDSNGKFLTQGGDTRQGGTFKGKYKDEWDDRDLWRYVSAPKFALDALVNPPYTTKGLSYDGTSVDDSNAVDLTSFDRTAESFDRAAQYFKDQVKPLEQWYKDLGGDNAAWKGASADVVRSLIETLHKNYVGFANQMGGLEYKTSHQMLDGHQPRSKYADALFQAQWDIHWQANQLRAAWQNWANTGRHDPHRALLEELDEMVRWIIANNIPHVMIDPNYTNPVYDPKNDGDEDIVVINDKSTYGNGFTTEAGFSDNPGFGNLDDLNTWKVIGERAVKRWNDNVQGYLVRPAQEALSALGKAWSESTTTLGQEVTAKDTKTLSETYEKEEMKKEKEEAKESLNDNKEAWQKLNDNLSDSNKNTKDLFDGINNNLADANNNQQHLNTGLHDLGNSLNSGLHGLNDSFGDSLGGLSNGLGGALNDRNAFGTGTGTGTGESLLDNALNDIPIPLNDSNLLSDPTGTGTGTGTSIPLNSGTTVPLNNLGSLFPGSSNGNSTQLNPDSLTAGGAHLDADGNLVQSYPDGSTTVFDPDTGQFVSTDPDGHSTTTHLNPGDVIDTPDGGTVQLNPDGTLTTTGPGGTKTVFDPSDGTLTTTNPDGTHTTTQLNHPIDIPDSSSFGASTHPGSTDLGSHLGSTHLSNGSSVPLNSGLTNGGNHDTDFDSDYLDYDSTPFTGGTLGGTMGGSGSPNGHTSSPTGGMPLNSGFGAGAGAGGGAGGGNNGERVRSVLNDPSTPTSTRRGTSVMTEGEGLPYRQSGTQTTSGPMGGAPVGGAQGGQSTESGERQRTNWVDEDEDVWGTEEGGTPAVIG